MKNFEFRLHSKPTPAYRGSIFHPGISWERTLNPEKRGFQNDTGVAEFIRDHPKCHGVYHIMRWEKGRYVHLADLVIERKGVWEMISPAPCAIVTEDLKIRGSRHH